MKRTTHLAALSTLILAFVVPNSASSNPVSAMSPVSENLELQVLSVGEAIAETAAGIAQVSGRTVTEVRAMLAVRKTFDGLIEEVLSWKVSPVRGFLTTRISRRP